MNLQAGLAALLGLLLSVQVVAAPLAGTCTHGGPAPVEGLASGSHAGHGGHEAHDAHAGHDPAPEAANATPGCDCGCPCVGDCAVAGQAGVVQPMLAAASVVAAGNVHAHARESRRSAHTNRLLRPPATLS